MTNATIGPRVVGGESANVSHSARQVGGADTSVPSATPQLGLGQRLKNAFNNIVPFGSFGDPSSHKLVAPYKEHPLVKEALRINKGYVDIVGGEEIVRGPGRLGIYGGDVSSDVTVKAILDLVLQARAEGGHGKGLEVAILKAGFHGAIIDTDGYQEMRTVWSRDNQALNEAVSSIMRAISVQRFKFMDMFLDSARFDHKMRTALDEVSKNLLTSLKRGVEFRNAEGERVGGRSLVDADGLGYPITQARREFKLVDDTYNRHEEQLLKLLRDNQANLFRTLRKAGVNQDPVEGFSTELKLDVPAWVRPRLTSLFNGTSTKDSSIIGTQAEIERELQVRLDTLRQELSAIDAAHQTTLVQDFEANRDEALALTRLPLFARIGADVATNPDVSKSSAIQRGLVKSGDSYYIVADNVAEAFNLQSEFTEVAGVEDVWNNTEMYDEAVAELNDRIRLCSQELGKDGLSAAETANFERELKQAKQFKDWFSEASKATGGVFFEALSLLTEVEAKLRSIRGEASYMDPAPEGNLDALQGVFLLETVSASYNLGSSQEGVETRVSLGLADDPAFLAERPHVAEQPTDAARDAAREARRESRRKELGAEEAAVCAHYEALPDAKKSSPDYRVAVAFLKDRQGDRVPVVPGSTSNFTVVNLDDFEKAQKQLVEYGKVERRLDAAGKRGDRVLWDQASTELKSLEESCKDALKQVFGAASSSEIDAMEIRADMLGSFGEKQISRHVLLGVAAPNVVSSAGEMVGYLRKSLGPIAKQDGYFGRFRTTMNEAVKKQQLLFSSRV